MKTIRERANEIMGIGNDDYTRRAERVLRELVEDVAKELPDLFDTVGANPLNQAQELRRRFLGPPSAEDVVTSCLQSEHDQARMPRPSAIVKALRAAGLLREEAK